MKNIMKKIGWTIVSFLPVLGFLCVQIGCMIPVVIVMMVMGNLDNLMDNLVPILILSQVVSSIAFGLWYYFVYGKKKRPEGTEKPTAVHCVETVALGLLAQFSISAVLILLQMFAPELMESYNELMEQAGIMEGTILTMISTIILAPLSEELVCRGLVFRLAAKVSPKFWVANIIQALAFGVLHGNLVQGVYAFALGIVLGLLYDKFKNIWMCMLLHAAMNASSLLVGPFYSLFGDSEEPAVALVVIVLVVSSALLALCLKALFGRKTA